MKHLNMISRTTNQCQMQQVDSSLLTWDKTKQYRFLQGSGRSSKMPQRQDLKQSLFKTCLLRHPWKMLRSCSVGQPRRSKMHSWQEWANLRASLDLRGKHWTTQHAISPINRQDVPHDRHNTPNQRATLLKAGQGLCSMLKVPIAQVSWQEIGERKLLGTPL